MSSTCFGRLFRPSSGALDCGVLVMHRRCCRLAASSVHYTTSCKHSLVLLRMSETIARNLLSWLKLLIKLLFCISLAFYVIVSVMHSHTNIKYAICIKRDQLDVTCLFISLFNAQHVSDVNTSILRILRLICWVISWVVLFWFDVCRCYVVVWLGWCGIRMKASACIRILLIPWNHHLCIHRCERLKSYYLVQNIRKWQFPKLEGV